MELVLRFRTAERAADLVVVLDEHHTIDELVAAVARHLRLPAADGWSVVSSRTRTALPGDRPVADLDIVSGDELALAPDGRAPGVPPGRPAGSVCVDVVAGPDSGRSFALPSGMATIGREPGSTVALTDPSVSRHHADLAVGPGGVVLTPSTGSLNGVVVNERDAAGPISIAPTDVVTLGGTTLMIRALERRPDERLDRLGQIDFHRTPYRPPIVRDLERERFGPIPSAPDRRRFQLLAALAPIVAGVAMWLFTGHLQFLALTLISPIVIVGSTIEDRRSGRRSFRDDVARFRERLAAEVTELSAWRDAERVDRFRASPDLADLGRRAEQRTIDLWARGRNAPDVLVLRLGVGPDRCRFRPALADGGTADLRAEAEAALDGLDRLERVPITVDLVADPVLGIHGTPALVDGVVGSLVVQAATLHSPEDLTIAAAVHPDRPLAWMKWLPHLRSVTSPLPGPHLATTTDGSDDLVRRLLDVAAFRRPEQGHDAPVWPRLLVVLDADLRPDPAEVARLLDVAGPVGISVVWLAPSPAAVPRQATQTLAVTVGPGAVMAGRIWSTDPAVADRTLDVEHLRPSLADRVARALAPVRDASTGSLATSIPRIVPLFDALGVGKPTGSWVIDRWSRRAPDSLSFSIGVAATGVLELDLVADGPHTLIGGTSGAGKSELLQSMVVALAAGHPPDRLNFLFVDYKGGAASQVFHRLPHTVGYVTNLSADLALRALTSLRAELNRRMAILEGRAKDLAELVTIAPDEAPPSLVIVVDEFATLVKEVPDFVAGIVDVAQRGRSLGIHLVLATQRPTGSVNENILANTNLRISLRMLDRGESTSILDAPDAAAIPVPLRGRGLVRLGPQRLVEFQSAYTGAPVTAGEVRQPVLVGAFDRPDDTPRPVAGGPSGTGTTQLDAVLDAIVAADDALGIPPPRRPWREVLPEVITLDTVLAQGSTAEADADPGRFVVVGQLDDPARQDQRPAVIDLEDGGGLVVYGSGGAGKTTALRTIAASVAANADEVAIVALDFASRGLHGLGVLPHVVDVATGDDLEAVTRHLAVLDAELERRRRLFADAGAEHLTAYRRAHPDDAPPRVLLLIDGFAGVAATFFQGTGAFGSQIEAWADRLVRIMIDGRQAGIHTVITADRRADLPSRLQSAIGNRIILRHADEASYADHGITGARDLDLPPGRGLLQGTTMIQIASVSPDPAARAQQDALAALAAGHVQPAGPALRTAALPDVVAATVTGGRPWEVALGVADITGRPVVVDLTWSGLTVAGPPRSGRSNALAVAAVALARRHPVIAVGPSSSPLRQLGLPGAFGAADELLPVLERAADEAACGTDTVLVIDDADTLDDPMLSMMWDRIARLDGIRIVAAIESRSLSSYTSSAVVTEARRARRLLVLQPDDPTDFLQATGTKLPLRPGVRLPTGRGVLLADRIPTTVQTYVASSPPV